MGKLGFIGLGDQGGPIARRMIDAGHEVVLWARRPQTLEPYADTPAQYADSIKTLGEQVEHCGICVVDDAGVQQVCAELIPVMVPGSRIVIHSTVHPEVCKTLARQAAERGLFLIDAPVSGGGREAAAGNLTVMMGGDVAAVAAAQPIFTSFAGLIVHLGEVGSGQMAKLINNNLMAANLALAYHALQAADEMGIDREALARMITLSSGHSFSFAVAARMRDMAVFRHGAALLVKDVRLLGETIGEHNPDYVPIRDAAMPFLKQVLDQTV